MNWRKSMFAIPRLCAVVLLKWTEAGVHVHSPCLGVLLVVDLTIKYFKSKRGLLSTCGITSAVFTPSSLKSVFVEKDGLVRAKVDVELFRSSVCDLVEVRLCFLENNHIVRAHHTVRHFALSKNPALQLKIERRVAQSVATLLGFDPLERPHVLHLFVPCLPAFAGTRVTQASDLVSSLLR